MPARRARHCRSRWQTGGKASRAGWGVFAGFAIAQLTLCHGRKGGLQAKAGQFVQHFGPSAQVIACGHQSSKDLEQDRRRIRGLGTGHGRDYLEVQPQHLNALDADCIDLKRRHEGCIRGFEWQIWTHEPDGHAYPQLAGGCPRSARARRRRPGALPTLSHQGRECASLLPTGGAKRVPAPRSRSTLP